MAEEHEHKYLVRSDAWRAQADEGVHIRQTYLSTDPHCSVRIRETPKDAWVTIKASNGGGNGHGLHRAEFEYAIPQSDASALLESVSSQPTVRKTRYHVNVEGRTWEIDEFEGQNQGLVLAEVEVPDGAEVTAPDWAGEEVSSDDRFQNANLATTPFATWSEPQFHFKRHETVREACVRIIEGEIDNALRRLHEPSAASDEEAVHEARKSVKKARATIRLLRPAIGNKAWRSANERLRDAGRTLSSLRDAHALSESLDSLVRDAKLDEGSYEGLRQILRHLADERHHELEDPAAWNAMHQKLESVRQDLKDWDLPDDRRFSSIEEGLRMAFRAGSKAFDDATADPVPENLHELRKRAKDHWYHLRLLNKSWPEVLDGYIEAVHQLEGALGDDHNLVLLEQLIKDHPAEIAAAEASEALVKALDDRREELRTTAEDIGRRIYTEPARDMLKRLERGWKAWQNGNHGGHAHSTASGA